MSRLIAVFLCCACTEPTTFAIGGKKENDACKQTAECNPGLRCKAKKCILIAIATDPARGDPCTSDADCGEDLVCGRQEVCAKSRGAGEGAPCGLTEDCAAGLLCHGSGHCALDDDAAGTYDLGDECYLPTDCQRPLVCGFGEPQQCVKLPLFLGPDCTQSELEAGAFRVHFEAPRAAPDCGEFYRTPFPIEAAIDPACHPAPSVLGLEVARDMLQAALDDTGAALLPVISFRFSAKVDETTLCAADCGDAAPSVLLVDVTAGSLTYAQAQPVAFRYQEQPGQYICARSLAVRPQAPLRGSTTYALVLTKAVRSTTGAALAHDALLSEVLAESPSLEQEPTLHAAFAPLRTWASEHPEVFIAAATMFSTQDPLAPLRETRAAVVEAAAYGQDWVSCAEGVASPCPLDAADDPLGVVRCSDASAAFEELQGTLLLPKVQHGAAPYRFRGGALDRESGAVESACASLTVPKAPAPPNGWPLVIVAHGSEESFRAAHLSGLGVLLAAHGIATLGYEGVSHGTRRGAALADEPATSDLLFDNPLNPTALVSNGHQAVADLFALTSLFRRAPLLLSDGRALSFDPARQFLLGNTQGALAVLGVLATENRTPPLRAAAIMSIGGDRALQLLEKQVPLQSKTLLAGVLADQNLHAMHPMMGFFSDLTTPVDPLFMAQAWAERPVTSLLHVYTRGDRFTSESTQDALLRALGVPRATSVLAGNLPGGVTSGSVDFDGQSEIPPHLAVSLDPSITATLVHFFGTALTGAAEIAP